MDILNQHVLVLNRLWQAVHICSVKRALCLLYQGHAQVIEADSGTFSTHDFPMWLEISSNGHPGPYLHTVSCKILSPEIILLTRYDKLPYKDIKLTRHNIFERDKNTCQYCGKKFERQDLNIDHVVPRDKGGPSSWTNLVCSCRACNTRKANHTPRQAGMQLLRKPEKPKWHPYLGYNLSKIRHESWRHFVDVALWKEQDTSNETQEYFHTLLCST